MDIHEVLSHLPHRYPFLLVDKVLDYQVDDYLVALKNVTFNEPFFTGHFPVKPIMPGVLIIEALAQATGLLSPGRTRSVPSSTTSSASTRRASSVRWNPAISSS